MGFMKSQITREGAFVKREIISETPEFILNDELYILVENDNNLFFPVKKNKSF